MQIRDQLVTSTRNISTAPNARKSVTVHQTGNTGRGANAAAHANLQSRPNPRVASWHWTVDDREAVRSFPHTARTFHAGTARGNRESISVEICVNSDGDYAQAVRNGATLVARILREEGLGVGDVVQHYYWTKKDCPTQIRASMAGIGWASFITLVSAALGGGGEPVKPSTGLPTYHPVTNAQLEALALLGLYDGQLDATPGPMSHAAITAFQQANGLHVDGLIGPHTTDRLTKESDAMSKQILAAINDLAFHVTGSRLGEQVVNANGNWARNTDLRTALDTIWAATRGDRARLEQIHEWEKREDASFEQRLTDRIAAVTGGDPALVREAVAGALADLTADVTLTVKG